KFHNATADVGDALLRTFAPALNTTAEAFSDLVNWVQDNSTLVTGFFIATAGIVAAYYVPAMVSAAVATLAATWPFILIGAILVALAAAFALAYDDVMNYLAGNKSMIGYLSEKYPWLGKIIKGFVDGVSVVFHALMGLIDLLTGNFDGFFEHWKEVVSRIRAIWERAPDWFKSPIEEIASWFSWLVDKGAELKDDLTSAFN